MSKRAACEASGGVYHVNGECSGATRPKEYGQSEPVTTMPIYDTADAVGEKSDDADDWDVPPKAFDSSDDSLYATDSSRMAKKLFTPALIGLYAVAGVYIGRAFSGTRSNLPLSTVALVAGSSAASAYAAPMLSPFLVCPNSASAPLVEAAISSAISFELVMLASSMDDATRFIPVQLISYVGGVFMAPKVKKWLRKGKKMWSSSSDNAY